MGIHRENGATSASSSRSARPGRASSGFSCLKDFSWGCSARLAGGTDRGRWSASCRSGTASSASTRTDLHHLPQSPFELRWTDLSLVVLASMTLSTLASLYPARRARPASFRSTSIRWEILNETKTGIRHRGASGHQDVPSGEGREGKLIVLPDQFSTSQGRDHRGRGGVRRRKSTLLHIIGTLEKPTSGRWCTKVRCLFHG